jgi:hypothetical protein
MAFLYDTALDDGLNQAKTDGLRLDIGTQDISTYSEIATYSLGNTTSVTITGPTDGDASGRKITVPAVSTGTVTGSSDASHVYLSDGSATLVLSYPLSGTQAVSSGNTWTLTAFDIEYPDLSS